MQKVIKMHNRRIVQSHTMNIINRVIQEFKLQTGIVIKFSERRHPRRSQGHFMQICMLYIFSV